jgi:signal peptidase
VTLARRIGRVTSTLLLAAGVLLGAVLVLPALLGWQRYVIVSGSMTGTYDRGSLVLDQVVPTASLKVGDVITYMPPRGVGPGHLVTHRIHAIATVRGGTRVLRTKGDANAVADPWTFTLPRPTQAKVRLGVPYVGYALAALSVRRVRMLVVGLPAALIAVATLMALWKEPEPVLAEAA